MNDEPFEPLPRSLTPLPGESLPGLVMRLSHRLDLLPSRIIQLTGLAPANSKGFAKAPTRHLLMLDPDVRRRFARPARLSEEEADQLTLRRWASHYPPIAEAVRRPGHSTGRHGLLREWVLPDSSRYCPQCLVGDASDVQRQHGGPWKLEWRLAIVFACLEHNRLLADVCPSCRLPALSGSPAFIGGTGREVLHPAQCRNRTATRGPVCKARLDAAHNLTAALNSEQVALQRDLLLRLAPEHDPVRAFETFTDLRAATAMIIATWPQDAATAGLLEYEGDLTAQGLSPARRAMRSGGRWGRAPLTSPATACVLRLAHDLTTRPAPQLRQGISDLMAKAPPSHDPGWGRTWALLRRDGSSLFRHEVEQSVRRRFSPAGQQVHTNLVIPVRQRGYLPEHIPQRLPREWLEILLANGASPEIRGVLTLFRRIAAIQLVQAANDSTATDAARFLGFPLSQRKPSTLNLTAQPDQTWRQAHITERLPEAFEALARHIANRSPSVNYYERRQTLTFWHLSRDDWENITGQLPPPHQLHLRYGPEVHRQCASAYVWALATNGEWRYAPVFRSPLSPAGLKIDRTTAQHQFLNLIHTRRDHYCTALRTHLTAHAQNLKVLADTPSNYCL